MLDRIKDSRSRGMKMGKMREMKKNREFGQLQPTSFIRSLGKERGCGRKCLFWGEMGFKRVAIKYNREQF